MQYEAVSNKRNGTMHYATLQYSAQHCDMPLVIIRDRDSVRQKKKYSRTDKKERNNDLR